MSELDPSFPVLPPGTSLIPGFTKTFGLVFIAIIVAAFLTGILTLQTYIYYGLFPNDPGYYKIAASGLLNSFFQELCGLIFIYTHY